MTIAAILKHKGHDVVTIGPAATVPEIATRLTEHRIGAVLVMDKADQVLGIVSERDIVRSIATNGASTLEMTAGQLMTRAVQLAHPDMTVEEATRKMTLGRIRHLPVMSNGAIVGMVSIGDVVKSRIMQQDAEVDSLRAYIGGAA
jgi:CBS domain-containing protein